MAIKFGGNIGFNKKIGGVNIGVNFPFGNTANTTKIGGSTTTTDNGISRMIASASNDGMFSRPNIYRLQITPPINAGEEFRKRWSASLLEKIGFNCDSISVPGHSISTKPNKTYSLKKEYAYDKIYDSVNATFYVSENLDEYHFFEDWQKLMFDQRTGNLGYYNDYIGQVSIFQLTRAKKREGGKDLATISEFKLIDCYPKIVSPLRLGYALNNQVQKVDVQFTFRTMISRNNNTTPVIPDLRKNNPLNKTFSLFRNLNVNGGFRLFGRRQSFNIFNQR